MIAEMLQDRLEDYIDVSVGNAKKVNPAFLIEERLDYLIIGDVVSELTPSAEIQNWLFKNKEISKNENFIFKVASGFYVEINNVSAQSLWSKFLKDNVKPSIIHPPILPLKLNNTEPSLENGSLDSIKGFINNIIDFFIDNN
jgi:hypothetical protein